MYRFQCNSFRCALTTREHELRLRASGMFKPLHHISPHEQRRFLSDNVVLMEDTIAVIIMVIIGGILHITH